MAWCLLPGLGVLLLAGEPPSAPATGKPPVPKPADNRHCFKCHDKFEEDILTAQHAKPGVGCVTCHGASEKHAADDDHLIPPDIMIGRAKLNESCAKCHASEKLSDQHTPFLAGKIEKKYCTECHGLHRLEERTKGWDIETGKPLSKEAIKRINQERKKS